MMLKVKTFFSRNHFYFAHAPFLPAALDALFRLPRRQRKSSGIRLTLEHAGRTKVSLSRKAQGIHCSPTLRPNALGGLGRRGSDGSVAPLLRGVQLVGGVRLVRRPPGPPVASVPRQLQPSAAAAAFLLLADVARRQDLRAHDSRCDQSFRGNGF